MLKLTNTLTKTKEEFIPINEHHVGMYNCGPTVYDFPHIGNARKYVFDDVVRRTLEFNNYSVHQVINITDVGHLVSDEDEGEDKIEKGARREGKTAQEITEYYTQAFFSDLEKLNIKVVKEKDKESVFPRATHHLQEQIDLISVLEEKGYTYNITDGIYFDTSKFEGYGKLGNINIEGLKEGARVEANYEKRNPTDFALWKFSKPEEKRQQEWNSPWGIGFPGWHIECSAMSMKYLGQTFDIHTGGIDHIPVHHNNEIAQSEAATGKPFVHYWLHEAFVNVDGGKMAKSLGNAYTLSDLINKGINPLSFRYWLLTAHYRTSVNFTWEAIAGAHNGYTRLLETVSSLPLDGKINDEYLALFKGFINDDIDTPKAIALMWELLKDDDVSPADKKATLLRFDSVLGLNLTQAISKNENTVIPDIVKHLLNERAYSRQQKDFKKSDELRDEIKKHGFEVKDTPEGQKAIPLS